MSYSGASVRGSVPAPWPWRDRFPALDQRINGHPLVYLDSAATTQRPVDVIDAVADFSRRDNANPSGTLHTLARRAHEHLEGARRTVAEFIGAKDPGEVIFTRGTTEAINLVAAAWGTANLRRGDRILLGVAEHASNMVPWQLAARRSGASLEYFGVGDDGRVRLDELEAGLASRPRLVAFAHVSNVLGLINPAKDMCTRARAAGATVLVDAAQSVPHFPVDVRDLGCDFLAFSGHKMLGPMGVGVLWGRREILDAMPPYQGGSNMAHGVETDPAGLEAHLADGAHKFGAGTPNVSGPVGLAAAIRFLRQAGDQARWEHERSLTRHSLTRLEAVPGLRLLGEDREDHRISVFSFTLEGMSGPEIAQALDRRGIATRGGDLASLPLLRRMGTTSAARASAYLYNSREDIDRLGEALEQLAHPRR
ncbi:MAG TPA: aminotransferase class V-fold PLP-dependent enzyme [Gemmatimonadales bacterium]|nr:aminotransferase class V-fold PLP-dependent enzyme [Gemmatimonadales bacterium]